MVVVAVVQRLWWCWQTLDSMLRTLQAPLATLMIR